MLTLAMLAPAAAIASGLGCEVGAVASAACCCDDGAALDDTGPARVERTCCCEIREAPAGPHLQDAAAPPSGSFDAAGVSNSAVASTVVPPASYRQPVVRARGPPPASTLLAQRVSFLC
ncbi:MAG TPA: hypothetical protein VML75_02220 [Kofleriaceae bacterium]|nr:hypothetical protein [Kofleriaceae bacterium]